MPSPAQGFSVSSPASANWWDTFLDAQGRDSEEEAAFDGFLTTNGIPAGADPGTLQEAYTHFRAWMEASEGRQADLGPNRADLAKEQAVIALEQQFVAKSRVSAPGVEKPLTAATRPKETREPLGDAGPGPAGEASLAPAGQAAPPATSGSQTPPATEPQVSVEDTPDARSRRHGRGSGEGGL